MRFRSRPSSIPTDDLAAFYRAIERGDITLTAQHDPQGRVATAVAIDAARRRA